MKTRKNMNNVEIAELLEDVAAAYQVKPSTSAKGTSKAGRNDNNRFKIIAYQRAADAVEHLSSEAKDLWDEGKLEDVSGIGKSIAGHLGEIFETGKSKHFDELMDDLPPGMFEIIKVSGIGPKTAYKLSNDLGVKNLSDLEKVAKDGKIAEMEGFGEDSQAEILRSIKEVKGRDIRMLLPYAEKLSSEVVRWIKKDKNVTKVDVLGSLRRKASTVGDLDIVAATKDPESTIEHFCKYENANRVLEKGERSASILLPGNKQVDIIATRPSSYGSLLQHFTGSKHHNIAIREYALKKGMSVSDYGIYKKKGDKKSLKEFDTEEKFYKFLGMEWIAPELREDVGEIEAALRQAQGKPSGLPKLVQLAEIKADLHIHSSYDIETSHDLGDSSMEDVVKKADELGYEYIAFTEHNPSKGKHNSKQTTDILKMKREVVEQLNTTIGKRRAPLRQGYEGELQKARPHATEAQATVGRVFNSLEIDILPDGKLPVSDEGMQTLDFALVSIHSSFKQSKEKMTQRVLRGLDHPRVKIFAHPTARKLNEREGIELDWEKIFQFCLDNDKWIEINAAPSRLDLPDFLIRDAVKFGIKLTLGTDSHHVDQMENMKYGVWNARRGWAEKKNIVNTRTLKDFDSMLKSV